MQQQVYQQADLDSSYWKGIHDVEYGNKHIIYTLAGMKDGLVVGHVPVLAPGTLGIYK